MAENNNNIKQIISVHSDLTYCQETNRFTLNSVIGEPLKSILTNKSEIGHPVISKRLGKIGVIEERETTQTGFTYKIAPFIAPELQHYLANGYMNPKNEEKLNG